MPTNVKEPPFMSVKAIWVAIQTGLAGLGATIAAFLGGLDGLIYALIAFVIADYVTGVLAAISERRVSSAIGFRGISRKIVLFALIGLAHLLDVHIIGTPGALRTATILFYLSNEGISLVENATRLGLPIPAQMRGALDAIANREAQRPPLTTTPSATDPVKENNQ